MTQRPRKASRFTALRDHCALYWQTYLAAFIVALLLLAAGGFQLHRMNVQKARALWPQTTAIIRGIHQSERPRFRRFGAATEADIWLEVTYNADGRLQEGRLHRSTRGSLPATMKQALAVGESIPIRFNPRDSSEIYLDAVQTSPAASQQR